MHVEAAPRHFAPERTQARHLPHFPRPYQGPFRSRGSLPGAGAFAGMASVAVFPGTVQVPPDGQPIVLLADAQTIGGYPVLGQVIAADLPQAAQLRPGDELRFEPVSLAEARIALREQEMAISAMYEAMR